MISFLAENIGTIIVGLVLLEIISIVIRTMIRDKKAGKSCNCGDACGNCPSSHTCHPPKQ